MQCNLCQSEISNYSPQFNQLKIDETHIVNLCSQCIDKIVKWQQHLFATLYPTKQAKKWANR